MYVIGTAGHVDHGKSTLIRALTGIDPDRLQDEKARGMTIDLGFAWLKLPSGREVSIVDVPGHERFIKNMLAGVGGIDLALLVIAADEGVMPQTREHLAILDLLQVSHGAIVVTKRDLVDEEWLELVIEDIREAVAGTSLAGQPIYTVSSTTGAGLPELIVGLDDRLTTTPERPDLGRPRLPIDRVFTVSGFGTVVTGTLTGGSLRIGQEVEIQPSGLRSRVRGLQTHRHKVEIAVPGSRVAVNLQNVATTDLHRGDVVATPGWLRPTTAVDVSLRAVVGLSKPIRHNFPVSFHSGAAETTGRIRLLDRDELEPGDTGWAQIKLDEPLALAKADFFIVRSTETTIGGGTIVDPHPRRHRRLHEPTIKRLETMAAGSPEDRIVEALQRTEPLEVRQIPDASGLDPATARAALEQLATAGGVVVLSPAGLQRPNSYVLSAGGWERLSGQLLDLLGAYHRQHPLRSGISREELKSRLKLSQRAFTEALARLAEEGILVEDGKTVRLAAHRVQLTPEQRAQADAFIRALEANPYSPPNDQLPPEELLAALHALGEVVRIGDVVFAASAYRSMVEGVKQHLLEHGKITVAEFRDKYQTSRRYALALLEHLDDERITMRIGDERVLRRRE